MNQKGEISKDPPSISFLDHGFLFGDSIYEVVRLYEGRIFGWKEHYERLERSAESLLMDISSLLPLLRGRVESLCREFKKRNAVVRMIISRGVGALHIDPTSCKEPSLVMAIWEYQASYKPPSIRCMIPNVRRNSIRSLSPAIKSGNYLNNVMAYGEAKRLNFDDALFLSLDDELAELTTSNIGWISKGRAFTPALKVGILRGVTRETLLRADSKTEEVSWTLDRLDEIDELFALSTLKEIVPIRELRLPDGRVKEWKDFSQSLALGQKLHYTIQEDLKSEREVVSP